MENNNESIDQVVTKSNLEKALWRWREECREDFSKVNQADLAEIIDMMRGHTIFYDGTVCYDGPPRFSDKPPIVPEDDRPNPY